MSSVKNKFCIFALSLLAATSASSDPLADPGDSGLRHDVQLLSDAGIITGPVTTWPIAWAQIDADINNIPKDIKFSLATARALARVQSRLQLNKRNGGVRKGTYMRGGSEAQFIRSFDDTPRGDAEAGAYVDWMGGHFAGRLELSYALNPEDDKEYRLDGSWIGVALGNWMFSAGYQERYWGPAWQGGLILSNNARPRPGVSLRRIRTTPFESKWLSWIGPWSFSLFTEQLEGGRAVSDALLYGLRIAFRPLERLEIGLSRSSQFGGEGRDVGFDTIVNVITGKTTSTGAAVGSAEGINSLGGGDLRWHLPYIPYVDAAIYGEFIGEDEKGGVPDLFLAQGGIEFWGGLGSHGASWRLVYERTDTKANVFDSEEVDGSEAFGIAYNNGDFPTGYRYRGRSLGYPADGDALLHSARLIFVTPEDQQFRLVATTGELNRGADQRPVLASRNSLTPRREDVDAIDLGYSHQFRWLKLDLGLGFTHREFTGGDSKKVHGWVGLSREF